MNESPSLNTETRLPRQVIERAERARRALSSDDETPPEPTPKAEATPPAPVPPQPQAPAPAGDPRESDPAYWKQRFLSVDGLWRQDRIRHKEQIRLRDEQIVGLQAELDKAKSGGTAADDVKLEDHFSAEELEAMTEEARQAARVAMLAASRKARAEGDKIKASIREKEAKTAEQEQEEAQQEFLDKLTELVPQWPEINKSEGWLTWLKTRNDDDEEMQDVLDRHAGRRNAIGVSKLFKEYLATLAPPTPPPAPPVLPSGGAAGGAPATEAPQPAAGKAPTQAEIKDFYKRAALGKVSAQERSAFETRIAEHYQGARA